MALKIPPPVIFLLASLLIYLLSAKTFSTASLIITITIWAVGLVIALLAVLPYYQQKTTIDPRTPHQSSVLITQGIYRFSRNPMYLSLIFGLIGWALLWQVGLAIVIIAAVIIYLTEYQIKPEERALSAKFGEAFTRYQQQVRRWL